MLHRIIVINSELYTKAEILLGDSSSIQFVGQNNIGKSSLINTLNFLYITDVKQMRFEANKSLKESLKHYFPNLHTSYVVFEIKSSAYECIIVKRNKENELEYYLVKHAYDENIFFEDLEGGKMVRPFKEVENQFVEKGASLVKLTREQLHNKVYSDKRTDNPVLLLSKEDQQRDNKTRTRSKTFMQIYRHLIHANKLSSDDFVKMIMVSSNTNTSDLTVFEESGTHFDDIEKLTSKMKKLQTVRPLFDDLKKTYTLFQEKQENLGKTHYTFLQCYPQAIKKAKEAIQAKAKEQETFQKQLAELNMQREKLLQEKGRAQSAVEQQTTILASLDKKFAVIAPYDTKLALNALVTEVENLEKEKQQIKQALFGYSSKPKDKKTLQAELKQLQSRANTLKSTINNFSNTLVQHISADAKVRQRLNTLLSQELLYLPKKAIKKQVTELEKVLTLFDGQVDISSIKENKPFVTIEELREKLQATQEAAHAVQQLLDNQEALAHSEAKWLQRFQLLTQVRTKPVLLKEQKKIEKTLKKHRAQEKKYDTDLLAQQKDIEKALASLNRCQEEYKTALANKEKYEGWKEKLLKQSPPVPVTEQLTSEKSLAKLYQVIDGSLQSYDDEYLEIERQMNKILLQLGSYFKAKTSEQEVTHDPETLIKALEREYEGISAFHQKRESIIDGVINTFVNPTQSFLERYYELKKYVKALSSRLDSYHISDIQKIELEIQDIPKLLNDLEQISRLKEGTPLLLESTEQSARLELLRSYINENRSVRLQDLFHFQLKLTKRDGRKELLSMSKQMQSKGSDKMIRVFLFLMLLKQFFVGKHANRLVIYVDEIGAVDNENIERLLNLCEQYHVLPIFAWTEIKEGFDKHYLLLPSIKNNGKLYLDEGSLIKKD
ncbi:MAG: hypothetical protein AAF335_02430 [Bacteroidota bacterium]